MQQGSTEELAKQAEWAAISLAETYYDGDMKLAEYLAGAAKGIVARMKHQV